MEPMLSLDFPAWIQLLITFILFAGTVAAGAVYVLSKIRQQRSEELQLLADTRGSRIEDLQAKVDRQGEQIEYLKGQLQAYQSLKAQEIAIEVARMLAPVLRGEREEPDPNGS